MICVQVLLITIFRLEIQAKVRQLGRNPGVVGQQTIETAREHLTALIQQLRTSMQGAGVVEIYTNKRPTLEPLELWDDIVYEPVPGGPNYKPVNSENPASDGPVQVEDQLLPLASNGNVGREWTQLEISLRITHAERHLSRVRDLIAEKSFQFSHVIRAAPRKAVNTRSRAEVKKINLQISVHCRLYTHCRNRLIILGAPREITNRFPILTTDDVKASTAIVNPNEPGSTQLKLSWIWQSSGGHRWGLSTTDVSTSASSAGAGDHNLIECEYFLFTY